MIESINWRGSDVLPETTAISRTNYVGQEYLESDRSADCLVKCDDGTVCIGWYCNEAKAWKREDMDEKGYGYLDHVVIAIVAWAQLPKGPP